jgi:hypothetical protein
LHHAAFKFSLFNYPVLNMFDFLSLGVILVEYNNIKVNGALVGVTVKAHSTLCCVETHLYCSVVINWVEKVCDTFSIT